MTQLPVAVRLNLKEVGGNLKLQRRPRWLENETQRKCSFQGPEPQQPGQWAPPQGFFLPKLGPWQAGLCLLGGAAPYSSQRPPRAASARWHVVAPHSIQDSCSLLAIGIPTAVPSLCVHGPPWVFDPQPQPWSHVPWEPGVVIVLNA